MKISCLTFLLFIGLYSFSQPNTDVYLFDIMIENGQIQLSNLINISDKNGYDNQPSFINNHTIVYTSTNGTQTDIAEYNINTNETRWVCNTESSEFSPTKIPNKNAVSAIRQGLDGTQKLYQYDLTTGDATPIINNLLIGYHVWATTDVIFTAILENDALSLSKTSLKDNSHTTIQTNIGRSLHKIPNTNLISYIDKSEKEWTVKSFNVTTNESTIITKTLNGSEDMCWTSNGTILMGQNDSLYQFNSNNDEWQLVASLYEFGLENITRININADNTKLVLVADKIKKLAPTLENISWISGTWNGEAFGGVTEEIWSKPLGGSMMASFKLVVDDKVVFYEIEIIREVNNTLILQLKHFNNDLKGWETKDKTIDFPLKELTKNKVVFEGMTFEKISNTEMNIYVDIHNNDGIVENVKFNYKKD